MTRRVTIGALLTRHNVCGPGLAAIQLLELAEVEIDDTEAARGWAVAVAMGHLLPRGSRGLVGTLCRPGSLGIRAGAGLAGVWVCDVWLDGVCGVLLVGADLRGAAANDHLRDYARSRRAAASDYLRDNARSRRAIVDEVAS